MQQRGDLFSLSFSEKDETSNRSNYHHGVGREPEDPLAPLTETESEAQESPRPSKPK